MARNACIIATGIAVLALSFGVWIGFAAMSLVLLLQALTLGAGGITVLPVSALAMGLVHEVYPDASFETDAMNFCRQLAQQSAEQMGTAKLAIEMAMDVGLAQARNVERLANSALMLGPDYQSRIENYIKGIGRKADEPQ